MLAVVTEGVGRLALRERPEPPAPRVGEVILRPEAVGICGSDFHFIAGELSEQAGGSQFPRVQGHEVAGRIEACGRFRLIGIHLDGGLQRLLRVPQEQVFPVGVEDPGVAAMVEPVSIAVRAVHRGRVQPGERVVVLGAGPIGQSVCLVARQRGAEVLMIDLQAERLELARELGADTVRWRDRQQAVDSAREWAGPDGPPVAVDATGAPEAVRAMVELVASAGRAVQVGMSGAEVSLRIGSFTEKELDLLGVSCCGADEFGEAVAVVERNEPLFARLISQRFALADAPEALRFAMDNPNQVMKVVIGGWAMAATTTSWWGPARPGACSRPG
jgi:threonine dehydrogenase-like Zn-dependent dehydrogenase